MKLLCLSNGHGEDAIAVRILKALQQQTTAVEIVALPIVGEGYAYVQNQIAIAGQVKQMPSGGFIYQDGREFLRDLQGGLLALTLNQLQVIQSWAKSNGVVLAVGDLVPLLFAWWSGLPYAFIGTAKSEYYLRDEMGLLPRRSWFEHLESWSGSVYLPWERWLMQHSRCRAVFPRDQLTTERLRQWHIPAFDLGNPMMDGLEPTEQLQFLLAQLEDDQTSPQHPNVTIALLPGSRAPEAHRNWQKMLQAVMHMTDTIAYPQLQFLAAIAPTLELDLFSASLQASGWQPQPLAAPSISLLANSIYPSTGDQSQQSDILCFRRHKTRLLLVPNGFGDCLHLAEFAIAMAGTATEQFVGLGKPAIMIPGDGPQFTPAFAESYTRLLGISAILVEQPQDVSPMLQSLLQQPGKLRQIADSGRHRMGKPGASERIAQCLLQRLLQSDSETVRRRN
jgi:uncharacterized protein (TIGR03492 family)